MIRLVVTADDFGLTRSVNEAVEAAHRDGILTSASLMVAGDAAADAVSRARRLPGLAVGLHLVLVEGPSVLREAALVGPDGAFSSDQFRLGLRYGFSPRARAALAREIRAQFAAFAATGLPLAHADAHKHMHLHPVVARLMVAIGREFGLRALRVPSEPPSVLARCGTAPGPATRAMAAWCGVPRAIARRGGMVVPDAVFGLAWSGAMTEQRWLRLIPHLPAGLVEIYTHPATERDAMLTRLMPGYDHVGEFAALRGPAVRAALEGRAVRLTPYSALPA